MQETEKWLLQISFQLMANNSLFITSQEQTEQQLSEHQLLLTQIQDFQSNLDKVRNLGELQISRNVNQKNFSMLFVRYRFQDIHSIL
jgi:nesprin-1